MDGLQSLNCFHFDDYLFCDEKIQPITTIERQGLIDNRKRNLSLVFKL